MGVIRPFVNGIFSYRVYWIVEGFRWPRARFLLDSLLTLVRLLAGTVIGLLLCEI